MEKSEIIDYFLALVEAASESSQIKIEVYPNNNGIRFVKIEFDGGKFEASIFMRNLRYAIVCDNFDYDLNIYELNRLFALANKKRKELVQKEEEDKISKIRNFIKMKKTHEVVVSFSKETNELLESEYKKFAAIRDQEAQRRYEAGEPLDMKTLHNYDEFVVALRNDEGFQKSQNAKIEEVLLPDGNVEVTFYFNDKKITEIISGY